MTMADQTAPTARNIQMPGLLRLPLEQPYLLLHDPDKEV